MTAKNAATARLLEGVDAGQGRWWNVELVKNVAAKPIKVTLMESQVPNRVAISTALFSRRTIATPQAVKEAAEFVLAQVGGYLKVVGMYGVTDEWAAKNLNATREIDDPAAVA